MIDSLVILFTKKKKIKKHSENADTSMSETIDLDLTSRSRKLMALDFAYGIIAWYRV